MANMLGFVRPKQKFIPTIELTPATPVVLMSDIHLGNAFCDLNRLRADLEEFKRQNALILINGDLFEAITPGDRKRWEMEAHAIYTRNDVLNYYIRLCLELFGEVASQIRLIGIGNHEDSLIRNDHVDITRLVIDELERVGGQKIHYGGYHGYVRFLVHTGRKKKERKTYHLYYHHGFGGHTKSGTRMALNEFRQKYRADIYWMGHKHQAAIHAEAEVRPNLRYEEIVPIITISTGTYLVPAACETHSHTPYEVRKALSIPALSPYVVLRFNKGVHASFSF